MKIAIFSDCHGDLPELPDDISMIFICGDICPVRDHSINRQKSWVEKKFIPWMNRQGVYDTLLVPGNHDFCFEDINFCERLESEHNIQILINKTYSFTLNVTEYKVFGTPYCKQFGNWAFMDDHDKLNEYYSLMGDDTDILLCHDAPDIKNQGVITQGWNIGVNAGNTTLAEHIKRVMPNYVFHGHIHSSKLENEYENVKLYNVSIKDEYYNSVNPVKIIEL